ncbi:hypothetical protein [Candidatus Uabimicrobium amorphum]|uniref:Uncharacterized protein n=1 Tax=Uabimicrobium amorphum TaxID=2596890 RepID=A0A5S9F599_UABAM|nr:hypothetical protein [Candidatus Uabimicrobium amorphum]BBM86378.1 hypothetical protein UABAM_04764 [Candidatus Uabimicrobium amorphum]
MRSISRSWGMREEEHFVDFPCDGVLQERDDALYRAVSVNASSKTVFRWLCQMRVAPYSYDLIDNLGRKSPQKIIPGLDQLQIGQRVMFIFNIVDFEQNKHITIHTRKQSFLAKLFGYVVVSYCVFPDKSGCRLVVKLVIQYPNTIVKWLFGPILAWGDLFMMRRQLLNFKKLSEHSDTIIE